MIKSVLKILFPIISFRYVSRILQADNLGKYNYSHSIVQYFVLLAALGISTYAIREGSRIRNNRDGLQKFCNEVFTINFIMAIIAYLLLFLCTVFNSKFDDYRILIAINSLVIAFEWIGAEWINSIFEDYLYITIRSLATHIISLVALFVFVHNKDDYIIYAIINVGTSAVVGISNYFYCRKKYVRPRIVRKCNFFTHMKPMLLLFANNLAITIYTNADITMLGYLLSDYYVGTYSVAVKIYSVLKTVLASILIVSIPRLSYFLGINEGKAYKKMITDIVSAITLLGIPCVVGVFVLAEPLVIAISAKEFLEATTSLRILSVGILFTVYGYIVCNCVLIPHKKEKSLLGITIIAAVVNIGLNCVLIPRFFHNGAAITTVIAELLVLVLGLIACRGVGPWVNLKSVGKNVIQALGGGILVVVVDLLVRVISTSIVLHMILTVLFSIIFYGALLFVMKNEYIIHFINKIRLKINRVRND